MAPTHPILSNRFSILGLARSGIAVANYLAGQGVDVLASDAKPLHKLPLDQLAESVEVRGGENAVREGDVVVISPGIKPDSTVCRMAHEKGLEVISDIELFYRLCPCPIVAITGTDGKSTTTALIGDLLRAAGYSVFVGGNIGHACMNGLAQLTAESVAVLEVSCFQLVHCPTLRPRVAVVTNIAEDHVEYHGSMKAYIEAKKSVFANMGEGDLLVLNGSDPEVQNWEAGEKVETQRFGWDEGMNAWSDKRWLYMSEASDEALDLSSVKLPGLHNVENMMAALLAVTGRFAKLEEVLEATRAFAGLEHRMEYVTHIGAVAFYNDSKATNPHAAEAVLNAFEEPFVMLAGGHDKGSDYEELGRLIAAKTKGMVAYGATRERLAAAIPEGHPVRIVEHLSEAVELGFALAGGSGRVILAPATSSFDQFDDYEHRGRVFKDLVITLKRKTT